MAEWQISEEATALHREALVWDNHVCLPMRPDDEEFIEQIARHRQAGCDVAIINAGFGDIPLETTIALLDHFRCWFGERDGDYRLVESAADIRAAKEGGQLAVAFDIEGAKPLGDDLSLIEQFYGLGVRWMLAAYNDNNAVGGGCLDDDPGLSDFGRAWVREMERVGMTVCCSHTGHRTARDIMEMAEKPVLLSHSNPAALHPHPRNVPDDLIRLCAGTGGVIGVNGVSIFHAGHSTATETLLRDIDYLVGLVGPAHVGLGLDYVFDDAEFDGYMDARKTDFPKAWGYDEKITYAAPEQLPGITAGLLALGYAEADIRAILGENWLRVAEECWG